MEKYTPNQVWRKLIGVEEVSREEEIDMQQALNRLSLSSQNFLIFITHGYTTGLALECAGITGNQTRQKQRILQEFVSVLNGGQYEQQNRPEQHRAPQR